jgi:hypothetical protein
MARVSTKEAAELISLVTATPADERVHRWPSLLTLLTRWTTQAAGAGEQGPAVAAHTCLHVCSMLLAVCSSMYVPSDGCATANVCFLATAPYIIPARPWERKQQQQQQQQAQGVSRPAQQQQQQQLLQQAASVVQLELQDRAQQACPEPSGAAAAALGQLFVPAVLFLSAALAASPGVHLRPLACRLVFLLCCPFPCAAHLPPNQGGL